MSCAHPLKVRPQYQLYHRTFTSPHDYLVPCGYCVNCRRDKQNFLVDRAEYEYSKRLTASFVTLTYNDIWLVDHCATHNPDGSLIFEEDGSVRANLIYKDFRDFIQRLKKYVKSHPELHGVLCQPDFSYMYCMEYGDQFGRPHAHILFFGLDFAFMEKVFYKEWQFGFVDVLPVLDGGIRYVTKYMDKMEKGEVAWLKYDVKGLARPKLCTSLSFGQDLLWDNVEDIVDNFYTYKTAHNKRRPISPYWKSLLTGYTVGRDVTKKSFFEKDPVYLAIMQKQTAERMIELRYHKRGFNPYNTFDQRKFKIEQAQIREQEIKRQLRNQHIPVYDDISECIFNRFGYVTYNCDKVRKLSSATKRALAEEYQHYLYESWLQQKFA